MTSIDWTSRGIAAVDRLTQEVNRLVASITQLKSSADQLRDTQSALATEVGTLSTAVDGLIAAFENVKGGLSAEDQATLDAAVNEITEASTALAASTVSLSAEQDKTTAANPPPAPPAP